MNQPVNRRSFLATSATSAAMVFSGRNVMAADEPRNLIDAHSHVWDKDLKRYPLAHGQTAQDLKPLTFTPQELLATCRPQGVNRVVLIQHTIYHRFDNRYICDSIAAYPGVFSGVAVIDHLADDPAAEVLRQKAKGIRGFRIVPRDWHGDQSDLPPEKWLDSDGMRTVWKTAGENGMAMCPLINPRYLGSVAKACEMFPDTNVVIDHFGRIGIDGMIRDKDLDSLCALAKHKNAHVKVSAFYALGKKKPPYTDLIPMIKRVVDAFGPERCMWASDAPYQLVDPNTYAASIDLIKSGIGSFS
jgi:predicted TIM-barrel fold metal-dependent hydrolase